MAEPCRTCRHYNNGTGDIDCRFCDPEFGEDRWQKNETERIRKRMVTVRDLLNLVDYNCEGTTRLFFMREGEKAEKADILWSDSPLLEVIADKVIDSIAVDSDRLAIWLTVEEDALREQLKRKFNG